MNCGNYITKIPYPDKKKFIKVFIYKQGKTILDGVSYMEYLQFIDEINGVKHSNSTNTLKTNGFIKEEVFFDTEYEKARKNYADDVSRLLTQFKEDAIKELSLEKHPCANGIYAYAYDKGHSGGLTEVFEIMCDLSDYMGIS